MIEKNQRALLEDLSGRFEKALAASVLAADLRMLAGTEARIAAGRPLRGDERARLESQGNRCADWSRLRLGGDADLEAVRDNVFEGDVLLAGFRGGCPGPDGRIWPAGLSGCRVRDAVIGNASLYRVDRLERQVIADGAVVAGVGDLSCPAPTAFGLGSAIHPGAETGVRTLWLWDGLTVEDAAIAVSLPPDIQKEFQARIDARLAPLRGGYGYVGPAAAVTQTRRVLSAYIGAGCRVEGAALVRESALLSSASPAAAAGAAPPAARAAAALDDAWVELSLLRPGARVESGGKVSRSLLLEGAATAWGGMVSQSVLGPATEVHKGEATACLIGPSVGFHHQALLISALWPEGRGNIAYGANVGSNHTGKKPDQEIRPGEGVFFGLGCSIKFPANYEDAPYSLIATGVSTPPQRVAFPFSLINQPQGDAPEAAQGKNEIVPGWMWSDNAYSLVRRAYKTGGGDGFFSSRVFAAELAHKALKARQALRAAPAGKTAYLEDSITGLGGNFLRAAARERALAAYDDYLSFFLMRTYADRPGESWEADLSDLVALVRKELALGAQEVPGAREWVSSQLFRLAAFQANLIASLARDEKRGRKVFDDYAEFHPGAAEDAAVKRLGKDLQALERQLEAFARG